MPIDKSKFDKSIDKNKPLCVQVKELLEKNKETAYSYEDIRKELVSIDKNYPDNIFGYIDAGVDIILSLELIACLTNLENNGKIRQKRISNETYYIWSGQI